MRTFEGYQKGVNLGGWISQFSHFSKAHFDTFITEQDMKQIADWGTDHVRVPLDYEVIMEDDGIFKEEGFTYIDNCISWCKKYGLHMILDLHKTLGYMFDLGAVANPDLFFEDVKLQDDFITIWRTLAWRYGKYADMLAFELLNEIVNPAYTQVWNEIAARAIKEIRTIAPDTYIIVGGVNYNSVAAVPLLDAPADDKIVYTFHCYEPFIFTHQRAGWVADMPDDFEMHYPASVEEYRTKGQSIGQAAMGALFAEKVSSLGPAFFEALFKNAIDYAEKNNVPLYCGEYGVIDYAPAPDTLTWFQDIHAVFEKYGIGRAVWSYKNMNFGIADAHYDEIRDALVLHL